MVRPGSQNKIPEKISGPVSEEQRKTNMELFSKMGIPSIASLKQKEEKIMEAEIGAKPIIGLRENSFDDPAFRNAWDNICLRIKEMGKDSLLTTLTRYAPVVDFSSYVIKLTIDNKVQEQDLSREKPWILEMIRDILSNDKVNFEIEHTVVNATSQPYTPREKFMKMAEKNPDLIYLAEKLKLDL